MSILISERMRLRDFLRNSKAAFEAMPSHSGARKFLEQTRQKVIAVEVEIGRRLSSNPQVSEDRTC